MLAKRALGTGHVRMCIHTHTHTGGVCLFIFGNGFVGISDLSLTGTQTDITSCTQILAWCRSVEKQQSAFFGKGAFICCKIGVDPIDDCSQQEGSRFCNLISFKFRPKSTGVYFPVVCLTQVTETLRQFDATVLEIWNNYLNGWCYSSLADSEG